MVCKCLQSCGSPPAFLLWLTVRTSSLYKGCAQKALLLGYSPGLPRQQLGILVQVPGKPSRGGILRPLKAILLDFVVLISSCGKPVDEAWEIFIRIINSQLWDFLIGKRLQLGRKRKVVLRSHDLRRYAQSKDFLVLEQRGMRATDAVDQRVRLVRKGKSGPGAVAVADGADFLIFGAELFGHRNDLGAPKCFAVAAEERRDVELGRLDRILQQVRGYDLAVEAGSQQSEFSDGVNAAWRGRENG